MEFPKKKTELVSERKKWREREKLDEGRKKKIFSWKRCNVWLSVLVVQESPNRQEESFFYVVKRTKILRKQLELFLKYKNQREDNKENNIFKVENCVVFLQ